MISFIIPVYNKGSVLYKTLSSLIHQLNRRRLTEYEIIVVNDGSTDNSFEEAVRFKKFNGATDKIKIFHYSQNIGKGFALRFGFYKSIGDTVVFLDGDMDIKSSQIIQALNLFFHAQSDMVIGSKYHPKSRIYYSNKRFLYSLLLRLMIKSLFNLSVADTQVGMKVFRREVLEEILPRLAIKRFAVDLELLTVANLLGYRKIIESPVVIHQQQINNSTVNFLEAKNFFQDVLAIFYRKNILRYYNRQLVTSTLPQLNIRTA